MILQGLLLTDPRRPPRAGWIRVEGERIESVEPGDPPRPADLGDAAAILCPGFIDAHTHLPQFRSIGCDGLDLLDWLEQVIYPAEAAWADPEVARIDATAALRRLLRAGTTTVAGYLTSHEHSLDAARHATAAVPLRGLLGQVLMDRNGSDSLLGHPVADLATDATTRVIPTINPRFAAACTGALLDDAARRAGADRLIQTHLAESSRECALVADLFPDAPHYTGVYDRHGLLTPRTLLAHCLHLADEEWQLIAERGCVVVHCPGANTFLQSGLFDLARARGHGVRLALGSDVAAGPDVAMPRVARAMIEVAKLRRLTLDPAAAVPTPADAWELITRGNAEALGLADVGRLEPGAAADVLVLRLPFPPDEHLVGRLVHTWRDAYIESRVVSGRVVKAGDA